MTMHDKVRIRQTHPNLWRQIMTLSISCVLLAVNFWYSNPTFNPFGISKNIVGVVFVLLGVWLFIVLNVFKNLRMVRLGSATSFVVIVVWGAMNTQQWFAGNASLQNPILYGTIATFNFFLLIEPPVNPAAHIDLILNDLPQDLEK